MGLIPGYIGATVFTVVQFLVFLFTIIATPIEQFSTWGNSCYTMWGFKARCSSSHYTSRGTTAWGCATRRNQMNAAAAFAIFSLFTSAIAFVFGLFMVFRVRCAVLVPLLLVIATIMTLLVSWACVAGVYGVRMCTAKGNTLPGKMSNISTYGAGFGLLVTAFALELCNMVILVLTALV